ncbi:MAG: hypothetical protein RRB22_15750 [Gammaproteobacteria bacterium]|nr:hypothetical protein [Gammaproteobacteria bacterium]
MKGSSYPELRGQLWLLRNINPFLEWSSKTLMPAAGLYGRELIFQGIVHRALDRLGINVPLYPVRGAASYSYLYLLIRIVEELPVNRILELGCGQSSVLLDRLSAIKSVDCATLEDELEWLRQIDQRVENLQLIHSPLVKKTVHGHITTTYDTAPIVEQKKFDVLLVDGPKGQRRRSRLGALELIETCLGDDFVIVFDDAERRGEQQTIAQALQLLDTLGRSYETLHVRSVSSQFVIAGGVLSAAQFF